MSFLCGIQLNSDSCPDIFRLQLLRHTVWEKWWLDQTFTSGAQWWTADPVETRFMTMSHFQRRSPHPPRLLSAFEKTKSLNCSERPEKKDISTRPLCPPYFISTCQNESSRPVKRCSIIQIEYHCFKVNGLFISSLSTVRTSSRETSSGESDDKSSAVFSYTSNTVSYTVLFFNQQKKMKVPNQNLASQLKRYWQEEET